MVGAKHCSLEYRKLVKKLSENVKAKGQKHKSVYHSN